MHFFLLQAKLRILIPKTGPLVALFLSSAAGVSSGAVKVAEIVRVLSSRNTSN
jgi:hypothetical protein